MDHVGNIVEQWHRERPDLNFDDMRVLARVSRLARLVERRTEETFATFGLGKGGFDVLSGLKRSGPPYRLSPTDLHRAFLISSGAMTNRIDRLEEAGLVVRSPDPYDRRAILVGLTARGHQLIDAAIEAHLATYARILSAVPADQRESLVSVLSDLLVTLEASRTGKGDGRAQAPVGDAIETG